MFRTTFNQSHKGFTLIELMIVVAIIAIISAIAIPSYRQYIKKNAEDQANARALSIASELSTWRSKRLSYAGFEPRNDCSSGETCYSPTGTEGQVYVPLGSDSDTYNFLITLTDDSTSANALDSESSTVSGSGWRMTAVPNSSNSLLAASKVIYMDSLGRNCLIDKVNVPSNILTAGYDCS